MFLCHTQSQFLGTMACPAFGICLPSCADSSHIFPTTAPLMGTAGDRFGATLNPTQPQPGSHWESHQCHW